jgi:hypothetical protein
MQIKMVGSLLIRQLKRKKIYLWEEIMI